MLNIKIIRYSVQEKDRVFVKGYRFFSFVKNMDKNMDKSIGKNLSRKYSQKSLEHAKQSATDALETTSEKAIQKTVETNGGLIDNTIVNKITKDLKETPKIFQRQLKVEQKNLKKDIYLQKKNCILLVKED